MSTDNGKLPSTEIPAEMKSGNDYVVSRADMHIAKAIWKTKFSNILTCRNSLICFRIMVIVFNSSGPGFSYKIIT